MALPPAELVQLLNSHVDDLTAPLRPVRVAVRDDPTYKASLRSQDVWIALNTSWSQYRSAYERQPSAARPSLTTLAALAGSLCAGDEVHQNLANAHFEGPLYKAATFLSAYFRLTDPENAALIRTLAQAWCNMITTNDETADMFVRRRLAQDEHQHRVICSLLSTDDDGIQVAALVLVANAVKGRASRLQTLCDSVGGRLVLDRLLLIASHHLATDHSTSAVDELDESPQAVLVFSVIREIIEFGLFGPAYEAQRSAEMPEQVSVTQQTLLKLLDGFLHSQAQGTNTERSYADLASPLVAILTDVAKELDDVTDLDSSVLAGQLQAAILSMHCLSQIGTASLEGRRAVVPSAQSAADILRAAEKIRARITTPSNGSGLSAFHSVRRSFAELVSVIAYRLREGQEAVRTSGALVELLPMCKIDDQNPTLREQAIFAIRNACEENIENQKAIGDMTDLLHAAATANGQNGGH